MREHGGLLQRRLVGDPARVSIPILGIGPFTAVAKGRGSAPMNDGCLFRARCPFTLEGTCGVPEPRLRGG